jgi:hypothetical protein
MNCIQHPVLSEEQIQRMAHAARLNLRMQKELKILTTDPPPGISIDISDYDNSSSLTSFETSRLSTFCFCSNAIQNKYICYF